MSPEAAAVVIVQRVKAGVADTKLMVQARTPRAAIALKNAATETLQGPSPSAPGSTPGVRSGALRDHWTMYDTADMFGIRSEAANKGKLYGGYLEHGTRKMAARPFVQKIQETAMPKIRSIFKEIGG